MSFGCTLALGILALGGCGGTTSEPGEVPEAEPSVESLRFSKLVAGAERYCGLREGDSALVCVQGAHIEVRPGPFLDFALHEDSIAPYRELCTIDSAGQVACDLSTQEPLAELHGLALGFFNSCALDREGKVVCWVPDELGGSPAPDVAGALELSVDMNHGCVRFDNVGHVRCFGTAFDEAISELHFLQLSVTPQRACGITLDPRLGLGVACVDETGITVELAGAFSSLDTNVQDQGCAVDMDGAVRCWGGLIPPVHGEPLQRVSVSSSQVCALDGQGAAHCLRQ
jgi:hypothetical protein